MTQTALLLVAGALGLYLAAAARQYRRGRRWSAWRVASFVVGTGLLVVAALSPALTRVAERASDPVLVSGFGYCLTVGGAASGLREHILQHLLLGMFAPLALVLAAPLTLALRTLPVAAARRLIFLLRSRLCRGLSHPATALLLNVGGIYLLYATPLFAHAQASPYAHLLIQIHTLAAGYLLTWSLIGPDPVPHRPELRVRLPVAFLAGAAHATLAKQIYAALWPPGAGYDPEQIRAAAQLMYYGGDLAELLLLMALFAGWYRARGRDARGWPTSRRVPATRSRGPARRSAGGRSG